uniref:Uncharacterized protein n=2 Tax=Oryza TaxID=4527 RepID=A0A0D3F4F7_9ORYZ
MRWGGRLEEGGDNLDDGCPHQRWSGSRVATGQYSNIGTKDYTSKLSAIGNVMLHCEPSSYYPLMGWRYRIEMIAKNIQG